MVALSTSTYSFSAVPASGGTMTFSYTSPVNTKLLVFSLIGGRNSAVTNNCVANVQLDTKQFTECLSAHYANIVTLSAPIWCLSSEQIDGSYTGTLTITGGPSSSNLSRPGVCQVTAFDDDFVPIQNARQVTNGATSLTQNMHFISGFVFSTIVAEDTIANAVFATGETVVQAKAVADGYTGAAGYRYGSNETLTTTFSGANSVRRLMGNVVFAPRLSNGLKISEGTFKASTFTAAVTASSYTHGWYKAPANADAVVFFLSFNAWDTGTSRDISSVTWGGVNLTELGRSTDVTATDNTGGVDTFVFHLTSDNFPPNREGIIDINVSASFAPAGNLPCLIIRPLVGFKNYRANSFSASHWVNANAQTETKTGTPGDLILGYAAISHGTAFSLSETDPITSGLTSEIFSWFQGPDGTANPRPTYGSLASSVRTQASQDIVFDTATYDRNTRAIVEFQPFETEQIVAVSPNSTLVKLTGTSAITGRFWRIDNVGSAPLVIASLSIDNVVASEWDNFTIASGNSFLSGYKTVTSITLTSGEGIAYQR